MFSGLPLASRVTPAWAFLAELLNSSIYSWSLCSSWAFSLASFSALILSTSSAFLRLYSSFFYRSYSCLRSYSAYRFALSYSSLSRFSSSYMRFCRSFSSFFLIASSYLRLDSSSAAFLLSFYSRSCSFRFASSWSLLIAALFAIIYRSYLSFSSSWACLRLRSSTFFYTSSLSRYAYRLASISSISLFASASYFACLAFLASAIYWFFWAISRSLAFLSCSCMRSIAALYSISFTWASLCLSLRSISAIFALWALLSSSFF